MKASKDEYDVVVVGSGIGGLSCGAMLAKYGKDTLVVESHYLPGGCAHAYERDGFVFDSGPSLFSGMTRAPYNPLRQVLDIIEESPEWITYDGWCMWVPEDRMFRFTTGPDHFLNEVAPKFGGPGARDQWARFLEAVDPIAKASAAVSPLGLRGDLGAALTLLPSLPGLIAAAPYASKLTKPFSEIVKETIDDRFLFNFLNHLSFAISGLPADSTLGAAMAYTIGDLHREGALLDYPRGGGGALIDALVRGLTKHGGELALRSHVEQVTTDASGERATGVRLRDGTVIRAREAVVCNVPQWSLPDLLPAEARASAKARGFVEDCRDLRQTDSFMHLHLGIRADGLPPGIDIHHTVISDWDDVSADGNLIAVSIPTILDPSLAPPGHHVIHAYCAGNEPYSLWEGLDRSSAEYRALKKERTEVLWRAIERIIPDVRERAVLTLEGSPLTHERFLRRPRGTYGPAFAPGKDELPGLRTHVDNLLVCGEGLIGIGVPAVAVSGAAAAHTLVPVTTQLRTMANVGYTRTPRPGVDAGAAPA